MRRPQLSGVIVPLLGGLRNLKHQGFLLKKGVRRLVRPALIPYADAAYYWLARRRPYRFSAERYRGTFVAQAPHDGASHRSVPRVIYTCWTGDNAMSENRQRGLASLRALNPDIEVVLVTPENLAQFVIHSAPLHPAYEHLSLVHRSDYLRCYLLHHHGGGYADIKTFRRPWASFFDQLDANPAAWLLGYREIASDMTARLKGRLGNDIRRHYRLMVGNGAYIARPGSPFTTEWYAELHRLLDGFEDELARHPGDQLGRNVGYPIKWEAILANITAPLSLKYSDRIIHDERIKPLLHLYR